jgi:hypothetical protein
MTSKKGKAVAATKEAVKKAPKGEPAGRNNGKTTGGYSAAALTRRENKRAGK